MTKLQEALRLSEEAFMKIADLRNLGKIQPEVIAFETLYTIREALQKQAEQEKQEPVAVISESAIGLVKLHSNGVSLPFDTPLYAAPVRTKDLTEPLLNELQECRDLLMCVESCSRNNFENLAYERVQAIDAVIAAYKEKNK